MHDKINEIKEYEEKAQKVKDENDQKKALDKWFSSVFSNYEGISPENTTFSSASLSGVDIALPNQQALLAMAQLDDAH